MNNYLAQEYQEFQISLARFFKACTVWDQYFLGLYQKPGTGAARWTYNGRVCTLGEVFAPYWGYSMFNLIKYDYGLNFWSSQDKAGIVMVLQAKTETAAMLNIAPVVLDSPSTHSKFERRRPRFALYWCEARKGELKLLLSKMRLKCLFISKQKIY